MAIKYLDAKRIQGLSSDTKPTDVPDNCIFSETDTYIEYWFDGSTWVNPALWTETQDFSSSTGFVSYTGSGGTIGIVSAKMDYDGVDQPCSANVYKLWDNSTYISDTMWTCLADDCIATRDSVTGTAPMFFGASDAGTSDATRNLKDANTIQFIGATQFGRGGTNLGMTGADKAGSEIVNYTSATWTGGAGADYWATIYRTSASAGRIIVYPTSDRTASADYDETWDFGGDITNLDRMLFCGQDDGPTGRQSDSVINSITFKNGVNNQT